MFTSQSLKARLWLFGLVSALSVAVLATSSIWHAYKSKEILLGFVDDKIALNRSATSAYAHGLQMGQALRNILLDPANKKAYDNFAAAKDAFKTEVDRLTPLLATGAGTSETASRLNGNINQWQPFQKQIIELISAGNSTEALSMLVAKETPAWREVRSDLLELVKRSEAEAEQDHARLLSALDSSRTLAIMLSLASFLLVGTITVLLARGIFKQVGGEPSYAASMLQKISQGDLTHSVVVRSGDTSSIIAAMSRMQVQIQHLIRETLSSADAVVQESEAVRVDATRQSQTAQEQSSATSGIAADVEELKTSIGVMSDNANEAGRLSLQSEKQAHDSLSVVSTATDTIQKVAEGMAQASVTMEELSSNVSSINGIVQTIREIADQTNLLALNAAIEAARAGEQGRGFAVVADEVRKLAERTTMSTQEISRIVGGVRQTTDAALETMAIAKALALESASHTGDIRHSVTVMDQSSIDVSKTIKMIADGLREQTSASGDIAQHVELIAQGIAQTHAASSESSRRSSVLVELSHTLKETVRQFKV